MLSTTAIVRPILPLLLLLLGPTTVLLRLSSLSSLRRRRLPVRPPTPLVLLLLLRVRRLTLVGRIHVLGVRLLSRRAATGRASGGWGPLLVGGRPTLLTLRRRTPVRISPRRRRRRGGHATPTFLRLVGRVVKGQSRAA